MKKLWIVALCLVLTLCLVACGGKPTPSDPTDGENNPSVSDTPSGGEDVGTDTPAGNDATGNSGTTTTTQPVGNVVDGNLLFGGGDTTTTTTTKKDDTPTKGDNPTTTTTTTTATQKPTTTVAPPQQEVVQKVSLPAAGYDIDGKGRIVISKSEIQKEGKVQYACITFSNDSKKNGKEWIIPEYSKVNYACYDKNGKELSTGVIIVGALDGGDTVTRKVELPKDTAEVKITGHNFEYWTPWN